MFEPDSKGPKRANRPQKGSDKKFRDRAVLSKLNLLVKLIRLIVKSLYEYVEIFFESDLELKIRSTGNRKA